MPGAAFTIHKHDHAGRYVWQYAGEVITRDTTSVCIQARFGSVGGTDVDSGVVVFRVGDRMTEWFYTDRWYNIFQIEDVDDGRIKGWYCNITRPAQVYADHLTHDDLALDLFVGPDGAITLLDEDEFAALDLPADERRAAWEAVAQIRRLVHDRHPPFDVLPAP